MSDVIDSKEMHDKLLSEMPEGASHEEAECPFCNEVNSYGGGDTMTETKTYTEDELTAAVKEAVAPVKEAAEAQLAELESELKDLRAAKAAEETEGQIADMQTELDKAEARAVEAEARVTEILDWLTAEAELVEIAEYLEAVKTERIAAVKEVSSFDDEYIEGKIDRWVAMSDEDFASLLEDYAAVSAASKASVESEEEAETELPSETAMSHTRTEETATTATDTAAVVFGARRAGVSVSKLNV